MDRNLDRVFKLRLLSTYSSAAQAFDAWQGRDGTMGKRDWDRALTQLGGMDEAQSSFATKQLRKRIANAGNNLHDKKRITLASLTAFIANISMNEPETIFARAASCLAPAPPPAPSSTSTSTTSTSCSSQLQLIAREPLVVVQHNFLSSSECKALLEYGSSDQITIDNASTTRLANKSYTDLGHSASAAPNEVLQLLHRVEQRVGELLGCERHGGEQGMQLNRTPVFRMAFMSILTTVSTAMPQPCFISTP